MDLLKQVKSEFYHGPEYYRFPSPFPEDWENDLKHICRLGHNVIKSESGWAAMNPKESHFVWDEHDRLLDLCERFGLKFIPNFQWEAAPAWLFRKHRCHRIKPDGATIPLRVQGNASVGLWMPCFDHPGTRQECGRFIEAYVKRYQNHPALLMWDVWVEPRSRPMWECACEYSIVGFRRWLEERFGGDLDQLNRTLHQRFGDWEDIVPPTDACDYTQMVLWRQWAMWSLEDRLRWAADLHRQYDKTGKPVMAHVGASSVVQDAVDDSSDDWLNARCVDFFGSSLPYFGATFTNPKARQQFFYIGLQCDEIRSLSPYYWIMEIYPDPLNWQEMHLPVEDLRFYDWTCIAHGAKGLMYWQYRPERFGRESLGMGLVDNEGKDTPRSLESKAIRRIVLDNEQLFIQGQVPQAQVGILYDHRSDIISRLEWQGTGSIEDIDDPRANNHLYKMALQGAYKTFWRANILVDLVHAHEPQKIMRYKVMVLPSPIVLDMNWAGALLEFVRQGGTVISEAMPAMRSEDNAWINAPIPGNGLDKLFGCRQVRVEKVEENAPGRLISGKYAFRPVPFRTVLEPTSGEVIGRFDDGQPAVVSNCVGKGKAILVGTYPGYASLLEDRTAADFVVELAGQAGVEPDVVIETEGCVTARRLYGPNAQLLFVFNYEGHEETVVIRSPVLKEVKDLSGRVKLTPFDRGLEVVIPPRDVAVLLSLGEDDGA